jgi:hypothetical protein
MTSWSCSGCGRCPTAKGAVGNWLFGDRVLDKPVFDVPVFDIFLFNRVPDK